MKTADARQALVALAASGAVVAMVGGAAAAAPGPGARFRDQMFYVVTAHPDDEIRAWSMIARRSDDYVVFVTLTQGEGTYSCMTHDQAEKVQEDVDEVVEEGTMVEGFIPIGFRTGAYRYQGPGSPVGEEDKGETPPLGNPWAGQGTAECKRARIASWHWFLDDMNALDDSGTSMEIEGDPWLDDDYRGSFCPPGHQGNGHGRPVAKQIGCAEVWADADGARVAFDLGNPAFDGSAFPEPVFGVDEITAALQTLRAERADWGLPILPEAGILAASRYYTARDCGMYVTDSHPEHSLVQEAVRYVDHGAGAQYGVTACPSDDPYAQGAELEVVPQNWATIASMNLLDPMTERRMGPVLTNYGWLWDTYTFHDGSDLYWRVFG